ncbi:MAG: transporter substrate-binding domain-containing protein [Treponema sp.]|nr:transporter substrate-binding domain-containing protein [Treponema sp.]
MSVSKMSNAVFVVMIVSVLFLACGNVLEPQSSEVFPYASFRDVPGVTADEIKAIEALQEQTDVFIYGMIMTSEAFYNGDGEIGGFSALICGWLTKFFGISFKPAIYSWSNLLDGLANGEIDFSGELTATEERRETYFMTDAIAERSVKYMRLAGSMPLQMIASWRPLRYAFLDGSTTVNDISNHYKKEEFEIFLVDDCDMAYDMLKSGEIDAFFGEGIEASFDIYSDIIAYDIFPIVHGPVSLATQKPDLVPIISVMQKVLENNGIRHLTKLYNTGEQDYLRRKLFMRLNEEERFYIQNNSIVSFAAEHDTYPVSFYDTHQKEWQGIAIDVLRKIEMLTGLSFEIVNAPNTEWPVLLKMLEDGKVSMISELIRTEEREGRFLWPQNMVFADYPALLSRMDFRNVNINEILFLKVGLIAETGQGAMFRGWFPHHMNTVVYATMDAGFRALDRGEIDLMMLSQSRLLMRTHFHEQVGYKANIIFDYPFKSTFGFYRDEAILCSIVDKALKLVNTDGITDSWMQKTYDYRRRLVETQRPWLISSSILFLGVITLISFLFHKSRRIGKKLEKLVSERTQELALQTTMLTANYEYAKKLSDALTRITRSPAISTGILKDAADIIAQEGCNALNVHCVGVWMFAEKENVLKSVSCYDASIREHSVQSDFELSSRREYMNLLNSERLIITNNANECKLMFGVYGPNVYATLDAPIHIDGKLVGVVCAEQRCREDSSEQYKWRIEEQNFASSLADLMALAFSGFERRKAHDAAELASQVKSSFLANMSHEIRTPMNSIMGFSELALDDEISAGTREYINNIQINTEWLLQIINDILDISKIESGKMELEKISFDMNELFTSCHALIMPKAAKKGITIRFYAEPNEGKRPLGDPMRLRQVLMNLLSNAIKFTSAGVINLNAAIKEKNDNTIAVHFEVTDTGIGMSNEQIQKIFDPFVQAESSTTRQYGGTGLGLSITRSILEMMGGTLLVESAPGMGSRFSFNLTFDTIDITDGAIFEHINVPNEIEKPAFKGEILVCEDNAMNQQVICEHLARVGLKTTVAENGKAGLEIVQDRIQKGEKQFDMIFMDMHMPVMDGIEASRKILGLNIGIPIVAMTANVMSGDQENYRQNGLQDCVGKPFTSQELWRCLLKHLTPVNMEKKDAQLEFDLDFQKVLQRHFVKNNQKKFEEIVKSLEAHDIKLAHRLVHTLKSNAGQLGKFKLQQAAADIEYRLKDGKNMVTEEQLAVFKTEMEKVLNEFAFLLKESAVQSESDKPSLEPVVLEPAKVRELLEKLELLVKRGSPECMDYVNELRLIPGSGKLIQHIEDFDFYPAMAEFAELKKQWG